MSKKTKRQVLPGYISVSRNVLGAASDFDAFELNIIVILFVHLRSCMYVTNILPNPEDIFLRFSDFSGRHVRREELVKRVNALRLKEIRYSISIPGVNLQVITGLFSSVVVTIGGVLARVSSEAIPWLLYIGRGVGFAQIEPELFIEMSSVYYKRLYLFLCYKLFNGLASFSVSREKLYEDVGIPTGTPVHDVMSRYLSGFQKYLDEKGSRYQFSFEPNTHSSVFKAGRPSIVSFAIVFSLRAEYLNKTTLEKPVFESLNLLRKLIPILKKRNPNTKTFSEIHSNLLDNGLTQAFCQIMSAYANKDDQHQANILPLILKDRFNINIFNGEKY